MRSLLRKSAVDFARHTAYDPRALAVSWPGASDPESGIDHYDLYVGGVKSGTYTQPSATVTGLSVNRPYSVYVVVVNGAGLSAASDSVIGRTLADPEADGTAGIVVASGNIRDFAGNLCAGAIWVDHNCDDQRWTGGVDSGLCRCFGHLDERCGCQLDNGCRLE